MVVMMNHSIMLLVLTYLAESGPAKSGEVVEGLKSLRISGKYASLVLTRCYRQRFVSRRPYKRGRERGYVYQLSDKGAEWLLYKASHKKEADIHDRKPVAEIEERSIDSPRLVVSNSAQVKFEEKDSFNRALLAATTIKLCDVVLNLSDAPETLNWARAGKVYWQLEYQKLVPHLPIYMVMAINSMLSESSAPIKRQKTILDITFAFLAKERREDAEYLLYRLEQERGEKERYKRLYEEKNSKCEVLERELERARGFSEDLKLGRQIGKLEAEAEEIVSHGKLISSLLQDRLSRKQRDEEMFSARLACHYINNRWWDILSPSSNIPLPSVRGSARGA